VRGRCSESSDAQGSPLNLAHSELHPWLSTLENGERWLTGLVAELGPLFPHLLAGTAGMTWSRRIARTNGVIDVRCNYRTHPNSRENRCGTLWMSDSSRSTQSVQTGRSTCSVAYRIPCAHFPRRASHRTRTVFAMGFRKGQGSEFCDVAVLLPKRSSPVLTRELLYTAVTRPRHKLVIHASPEMIVHAITRRTERLRSARLVVGIVGRWPRRANAEIRRQPLCLLPKPHDRHDTFAKRKEVTEEDSIRHHLPSIISRFVAREIYPKTP